jgi:hypothetical protein
VNLNFAVCDDLRELQSEHLYALISEDAVLYRSRIDKTINIESSSI